MLLDLIAYFKQIYIEGETQEMGYRQKRKEKEKEKENSILIEFPF